MTPQPQDELDAWQAAGPQSRPESSSAWAWMKRAPVERLTLPVAGATWLAADILHAVAVSPLIPVAAALLAARIGYKRVGRHVKRMAAHQGHEPERNYPADTAAAIGAAGGWLAAATAWGPGGILGYVWLGVSFSGYLWLRFWHPGVQHARTWRARRRAWTGGEAHSLGLHGSHITHYKETRLGEWFRLDVTGTGRMSSSLAGRHTAERIAQRRRLPVSRVLVTQGAIAGDLEVSIRDRDPWHEQRPHPLLDPDPQIPLTVGGSILDPAVFGADPEEGHPLDLALFDRDLGARRILVMGTPGYAGKTVLMNCFRERVTAAADAVMVSINLSKGIEDRAWAPACHLTAIGAQQAGRAQQIMDLLVAVIDIRPTLRSHAVFRPGTDGPAIVLFLDEADVATPHIKQQLRDVLSKGRSEGITVILAAQRAYGGWIGGRDTRSLVDAVCAGTVTRTRETDLAAGSLAHLLPDMTAYGEGSPGVWGIAEITGRTQRGRSFPLTDLDDSRRFAHDRARSQPVLEPALVAALRERLGDLYDGLLGSDAFAAWAASYPPVTSDGEPAEVPAPGTTLAPPPDGMHTEERETARAATDDLEAWPVHDDQFPATPADRRAMLRSRIENAKAANARADAIQAQIEADDPAQVRAAFDRAWEKQKASTPFPEGTRKRLLELLADGTTSRQAAADLGVPASRALTWLHRLRDDRLARLEGKGRGSRWVAAEDGDAA
jgi:hypothetical protein